MDCLGMVEELIFGSFQRVLKSGLEGGLIGGLLGLRIVLKV
jgi:hypothetical protein